MTHQFAIPVGIPASEHKNRLHTYASYKRWLVQSGGTIVGNLKVPTDAATQGVLTAAYVKAKANPNYTVPKWKIGVGVYVELTASQIIAIGDAAEAHVQQCFALNDAIDGEIEGGVISTPEEIDDPTTVGLSAWPSNG